jgi:hypothetical protein
MCSKSIPKFNQKSTQPSCYETSFNDRKWEQNDSERRPKSDECTQKGTQKNAKNRKRHDAKTKVGKVSKNDTKMTPERVPKSVFLPIQVISSSLLTFQSVALSTSESKNRRWWLGRSKRGYVWKKTKLWPEGGQKGSQQPDLGTLFGVIFWYFSHLGFRIVSISVLAFFCALLDAFVGFGSPSGDHFAIISDLWTMFFPNMFLASMFDRFWDGFW